jgi:hypothetical protein
VSRYEQNAAIADTPMTVGLLAWCHALLAADEDADVHYRTSGELLHTARAAPGSTGRPHGRWSER